MLLLCFVFRSKGDGEGDSIVAYYQSEFDVHVSQQASLDEAIESQELAPEHQQGRKGRVVLRPNDALSVNSIVLQGQNRSRE